MDDLSVSGGPSNNVNVRISGTLKGFLLNVSISYFERTYCFTSFFVVSNNTKSCNSPWTGSSKVLMRFCTNGESKISLCSCVSTHCTIFLYLARGRLAGSLFISAKIMRCISIGLTGVLGSNLTPRIISSKGKIRLQSNFFCYIPFKSLSCSLVAVQGNLE